MQRKFTLLLILSVMCLYVWADFNPSGRLLFKEDFGGNDSTDMRVSQQPIESMSADYAHVVFDDFGAMGPSCYIVTKSGYCNGDTSALNVPENRISQWHLQDDHTYPNDYGRGYMLEIDGSGTSSIFYTTNLGGLCAGTKLQFSAWAVNVFTYYMANKIGIDAPNLLFAVYDAVADTLIASVPTGDMPLDSTDMTVDAWHNSAQWHQYGMEFEVPEGVDSVRLSILNNTGASVGNDFALDDIEIYLVVPTPTIDGNHLVCANDTLRLVAQSNNDGTFVEPLQYQWFIGDNLIAGATTDTLLIPNFADTNVGNYRVVVGSNGTINQPNCVGFSDLFGVSIGSATYYEERISLTEGTPYNEVYYESDTTLIDTLVNSFGCDSIHSVIIEFVSDSNVIKTYVPTSCSLSFNHEIACGDSLIEFTLLLDSGLITRVQFTIDTLTADYYPTTDSVQESVVNLAYRPGEVIIKAEIFQYDSVLFELTDTLHIQYPASVLYQKWNDFIGVLTHKFNGGYDLMQFQWYKNDSIMVGETGAYIYQPLEVGAAYSVMLTDSAGHSAMTCPLIAIEKADTVEYPSVVTTRRKIRVSLPYASNIVVYNISGQECWTEKCPSGASWLSHEFRQGIYLVAIYQDDNKSMQTYKILVK